LRRWRSIAAFRDPVEPRHQRLVRQIRQPVQVSREGVLQEVFGQGTVTDAALKESQEGPVVLDEHIRHSGTVVGRIRLSGAQIGHTGSIGTGRPPG
jgi:hypothetical protein